MLKYEADRNQRQAKKTENGQISELSLSQAFNVELQIDMANYISIWYTHREHSSVKLNPSIVYLPNMKKLPKFAMSPSSPQWEDLLSAHESTISLPL